MMVIRVKMPVTAETKGTFIAAMQNDITASRQFEGCMQFDLYEDTADENMLLLYEEWETQSHFDAYRTSEHFAASGKVLFPLIHGTPDTAYFDATKVQ
jgi:quinol monooxygenase YgiN